MVEHGGKTQTNPRQHLFQTLGLTDESSLPTAPMRPVGKGHVVWLKRNPVSLARSREGDETIASVVKAAVEKTGMEWRVTNYLALRRGPYWIGAGLDEADHFEGSTRALGMHCVDLFDPEPKTVHDLVGLTEGRRCFLLDLDRVSRKGTQVLASACKALPKAGTRSHVDGGRRGRYAGDRPDRLRKSTPIRYSRRPGTDLVRLRSGRQATACPLHE